MSYLEKVDDTSPSRASFSMYGSRATIQLIMASNEFTPAMMIDILGDTKPNAGGGLKRKLPKAHPRWPWLFASRIDDVVGIGQMTKTEAVFTRTESTNIFDAYAAYDRLLATVVFEPRPYAVVSDSLIQTSSVTWYDENNQSTGSTYASEWMRFTSFSVLPQSELIEAKQGQSVFRLTDSTVLNDPQAPHLNPFPAFPRMTVPKATFKVRWYQVPLNFVTSANSHIVKALGRINYQTWGGFPAGSLLYETVAVSEPYVPVVPALSVVGSEAIYTAYKLVDIDFVFQYTNRTAGYTHTVTLANQNWKMAGHNLLPWLFDKKFYYATAQPTTAADSTKYTPTFLSYPFELLFSNPDV
jgi:hypothetical protein